MMSYTLSDFIRFYQRLDKIAKISLLSSAFFIGWLLLSPLVPSREIPDTVTKMVPIGADKNQRYFLLITEYLYVYIDEPTYDGLSAHKNKPIFLGLSYLNSDVKYIAYKKNGFEEKINVSGVVNTDSGFLVMIFIMLLQLYTVLRINPVREHLFYNFVLIFAVAAQFLYLLKINFLTNLYEQFKPFP